IRCVVQAGDHAVLGTLCRGEEADEENRRAAGQVRTAAQEIRKGQILEPDKCLPVVKSSKLLLELWTPEVSEDSGPHYHEHLPRLRQQLQDRLDEQREIVERWNGGLVVAQRRVEQESLIDRGEEQWRVGKQLLAKRPDEYCRGASDRDDQVRLRAIGVNGQNVVKHRLCGCA